MATQPAEKPKKARNAPSDRGPNPAHILLDAISGALKGGVSNEQLVLLVDMARQAYGTDQSTSWKMVANTLRERTAEANGNVAQAAGTTPVSPGPFMTGAPEDSPDAG
jgi:hypothetical protein